MTFEHPWDYQNRAVEAGIPPMYGQQVLFWTHAQLKQRDRLLDEKDPLDSIGAACDAAFFVLALNNVRRACSWAAKGLSEPAIEAEIAAYDVQVPSAQHVRDILEHFDKYMKGTGHLQQESKRRFPPDTLPFPYTVSHHFSADPVTRERDVEVKIDGQHVAVRPASQAAAVLAEKVMAVLERRMSEAQGGPT